MRLILLGPPGSGKGTLAAALCKRFPFVHISTGELFRRNIRNETALGKEVRSYMDAGELVPDRLTLRLVQEVLQDRHYLDHFLMDGFPRTIEQAKLFDSLLHTLGVKVDVALHVHVPDETIRTRLVGRRVCRRCGRTYHIASFPPKQPGVCDSCGGEVIQREDDLPDVIDHRLQAYHQQTAPLVAYYRKQGILIDLDNSGPLCEVMDQLAEGLSLEKK